MTSLATEVISNQMPGMSNKTADFTINEMCLALGTEHTIDQQILSLNYSDIVDIVRSRSRSPSEQPFSCREIKPWMLILFETYPFVREKSPVQLN